MATRTIDDLQPGQFFVYKGPRRWVVLPTAGAGQILAIERTIGVVHVRLFWPAPDREHGGERLDVAVNHLPIVWSQFDASVRELMGARAVPLDALASLASWCERRARDEVGAFDVPLWRALQLAWETVVDAGGSHREATPETTVIDWAFPMRNAAGIFNVVQAVACARVAEAPRGVGGSG